VSVSVSVSVSVGVGVLFRLVSTELLEGDFYTCAQYQA